MVVATDTSVPSDSYSSFQWQRIEEMDCKLFQRLLHLSGFSKFQTQTPCLFTRVKTVIFFNLCTHRKSSNYCKVVYTRIYASMYNHID